MQIRLNTGFEAICSVEPLFFIAVFLVGHRKLSLWRDPYLWLHQDEWIVNARLRRFPARLTIFEINWYYCLLWTVKSQPRSHGSLSCSEKQVKGRRVNNYRFDKSYSVEAREEFAASLIISWRHGYLKMSTTPEKIVLHIARENAGNKVGYILAGISCTLSIN